MIGVADLPESGPRAKDNRELEERLSLRIGSAVRISHPRYGDRLTGFLEILYLKSNSTWHTLHFQFRGGELKEISIPLDWNYEVLLDGNWRSIHEGTKTNG